MYFQKVTQLLSSDGYIFSGRSQYGFRANAHVRQLYCRTTMPTYLYIGENEFFLTRTIKQLKTHTLDQQWANFNHTEYPPESKETIPQALSDIMTPPVGSGGRLVHQQHITGSLYKRNLVAVGVHSPQNSLNQ